MGSHKAIQGNLAEAPIEVIDTIEGIQLYFERHICQRCGVVFSSAINLPKASILRQLKQITQVNGLVD